MSRKNKNINNIPNLGEEFTEPIPNDTIEPVEEVKEDITNNIDPVVESINVEEKPVKEKVKEEKPVKKEIKEVTPTISNPVPIKNEEKKEEKPQPSIVGTVFTKGKLVKLTNIPVYSGPMSLYPTKYLSGNYFIYDGIERAYRYRICASRKDCGKGTKYIVGYIEKKYLK